VIAPGALANPGALEDIRERAAANWYTPAMLRSMAESALALAASTAKVNPEKAWELTQFAADMLRASIYRKDRI
jgi:hypothetical protein